jgi:protocatechuate 3,4-dioxygenase beta subunit
MTTRDLLTRRRLLTAAAVLALPETAFAQEQLPATPACHDGDEPTLRETAGPFFKPTSPERADLREPGMAGRPLDVSGFVVSRACQPVAHALIDVWQADDTGAYDNQGFRLRGHLFTDAAGRYTLRTVVPGAYAGRTPPHPREGAGAGADAAHDPALFPRRAAQPHRRALPPRTDHAARARRRAHARAVRFRPRPGLERASDRRIAAAFPGRGE